MNTPTNCPHIIQLSDVFERIRSDVAALLPSKEPPACIFCERDALEARVAELEAAVRPVHCCNLESECKVAYDGQPCFCPCKGCELAGAAAIREQAEAESKAFREAHETAVAEAQELLGHEARIAHLEKENKKLRDECTKLHVLNWAGPPPAYREARAALDHLEVIAKETIDEDWDPDNTSLRSKTIAKEYGTVLRVLLPCEAHEARIAHLEAAAASCSSTSDWGCEARRKLGIARGHLESIRELLDDEREPNDSIRAVIDLAMSETAQPELCSSTTSPDPLKPF